MPSRDRPLVCAGFYLGHPATGPDPDREPDLRTLLDSFVAAGRYGPSGVFSDLEAAVEAASLARGKLAPQGLWLTPEDAQSLEDEVEGTTLGAVLARGTRGPEMRAVAEGHDVVGLGGDLRLSFAREELGLQLCRRLGLPADPPPFLPEDAARGVCEDLNDEELGAPVLWVCCWRTVHPAP